MVIILIMFCCLLIGFSVGMVVWAYDVLKDIKLLKESEVVNG